MSSLRQFVTENTDENDLVLSVLPLAFHLSKGDEDQFSEILLEAVKRAKTFKPSCGRKFGNYAYTSFLSANIKEYLKSKSVGGIRCYRRASKNEDGRYIPTGVKIEPVKVVGTKLDYNTVDLDDELELKLSDMDRKIVKMLLDGHSHLDVAKFFGKKRHWIYTRLKAIRKALS